MNKKVIALIALLLILSVASIVMQRFHIGTSEKTSSEKIASSASSVYSVSTGGYSSVYINTSSAAATSTASGGSKQTATSKQSLTSSQITNAKDKLISDLNGLKE